MICSIFKTRKRAKLCSFLLLIRFNVENWFGDMFTSERKKSVIGVFVHKKRHNKEYKIVPSLVSSPRRLLI